MPSAATPPAFHLPMRAVPFRAVPVLAIAALLLAGCASTTQRAYVAPTFATIISTTEERQGNPPVHLIYVRNQSTVPVVVFSTSLSSCENVKGQCSVRPANVRIGPGQSQVILRVQPDNTVQGFSYRSGFSWRADSSDLTALSALAATGEASSQQKLSAIQRADSLRRAERGPHVNELTRDDFTVLAGKAVAIRGYPDSLLLAPGEKASLNDIRLLVLDDAGTVLGATRWVRWQTPSNRSVQFTPPETFLAQSPGRAIVRFRLADEAQTKLGREIPEISYPIVVAYAPDPNAPIFAGIATDADSHAPLGCTRVALEDSVQNVVASDRTSRAGTYYLSAPRPGTYRVRIDAYGWAPVYGPAELASSGEQKQAQLAVRFSDQLLMTRPGMDEEEFRHASPAAVSTLPFGGGARGASAVPVVSAVTLGGSASTPVLGIVGSAPAGNSFVQFVVDSTGRVDIASVQVPMDAGKAAAASVRAVLPRVRFSPARAAGKPVCELLRMQVSFSKR
ncbi:MAG: carboxypeptidase-like regulatory domain-containing protein [Gemmatimonadaceae bacterium]